MKKVSHKKVDAAMQTIKELITYQQSLNPFVVCETLYTSLNWMESYKEATK